MGTDEGSLVLAGTYDYSTTKAGRQAGQGRRGEGGAILDAPLSHLLCVLGSVRDVEDGLDSRAELAITQQGYKRDHGGGSIIIS